MTTISSFINRLKKIGIEVELFGNYPWIYLDTINGVKVKENFLADHGFTVFFAGVKFGEKEKITNIKEIFKLIRKYGMDKSRR